MATKSERIPGQHRPHIQLPAPPETEKAVKVQELSDLMDALSLLMEEVKRVTMNKEYLVEKTACFIPQGYSIPSKAPPTEGGKASAPEKSKSPMVHLIDTIRHRLIVDNDDLSFLIQHIDSINV